LEYSAGEKVYRTRFANIDELKCKLLREWAKIGWRNHCISDQAVASPS